MFRQTIEDEDEDDVSLSLRLVPSPAGVSPPKLRGSWVLGLRLDGA